MIIGQTFMCEIVDSKGSVDVWTPWMPRQGNAVTSVIEVIAMSGSSAGEVDVALYHKNSDDSGDGTAATVTGGPTTPISGPAVSSFHCTDCKELVRDKITLQEGLSPPTSGLLYAHFRMLPPSWQTTGVQGV